MNVEQNLRWEFTMTDEEGRELKKLFGKDLTGLKNLGNSCYLNNLSGPSATSVGPEPEKIEMLGAMGFGPPQARKALKETNGNVERAVEWLFSHPDDQGEFEDDKSPVPVEKNAPGSSELPAKFQLQSIICHKGVSIHAGLRRGDFLRKDPGIRSYSQKIVKRRLMQGKSPKEVIEKGSEL
ncbi:putative Ubiquitin carboxyl-terminal hydrolase 14 [Glarea lozoyensis 74030]|uniref:Putative Ubiquitin carboxyl-terminal hydrolase 14 n=1 Tax=Glarea lozoyensis (strain ATCC 74030 / MF5533) TaxID=1104152 RepID=H0ENG6_GLAL7|nr:putative Ubiquitin carboxyl-terminal hydrolase 14 [Glarea lozoyensis 74030]